VEPPTKPVPNRKLNQVEKERRERKREKEKEKTRREVQPYPRRSAAKACCPKNERGPGQPPRPHSYVLSCLPCHRLAEAASGGTTAWARQRPRSLERRVPHLPKPVAVRDHAIHRRAIHGRAIHDQSISRSHDQNLAITNFNRCGCQLTIPAPKSRIEEEAAMPGHPSRACARFRMSPGDSPSRTTGGRWLCRNHSASSGTLTFR
jgi:hypothetical protein